MADVFRYRVVHDTTYDYETPISRSQQLLHLTPRPNPRQRCLQHELLIEPVPARRIDREDCFGNPVCVLEFDRAHRRLSISSVMRVEVTPHAKRDATLASPPWEDVVDRFDYLAARGIEAPMLDAFRFRFESTYVRVKGTLADYARDCFPLRRPLLDGVDALMHKINREFTFDADATHISTPLLEVLENKRGVCQDFAHLMIGCLRSLGLPARYVSGYLLTRPPPGRPRLVGADASHAWVAAFCPLQGWIDFDPTNDVRPDGEHITVAWGRDFGDISPQRGVILGGGDHELDVGVTVTPE